MTSQAITYVEHLAAAQVALDEIETHANPLYQAAISQAHALAAIGQLLELLLGAVEQERAGKEVPFRFVRIVGGGGALMTTPTQPPPRRGRG